MKLPRPGQFRKWVLERYPAIRFLAPAVLITVAMVRYRWEQDRWWASLIMAAFWTAFGWWAARTAEDEILDLADPAPTDDDAVIDLSTSDEPISIPNRHA